MTGRVLFHVQYLLGIGHLQRSLRIAEALVERGIAVTMVRGGPLVPEVGEAHGVEMVQLPPIRARDATFALVDERGTRSTMICAPRAATASSPRSPSRGRMRW